MRTGVSDPSKKYAVTSSHVVQKRSCQCSGYRLYKDAMPSNQRVYLDASAVGPLSGQSSPNIIGLGAPKGFMKPTVGMQIHQGGVRSGRVDSQVTQINFAQKGNTYAQGNCPVTFMDMFVTSRCGTNGDSGAAQYNDQGYLVGIVTFGSTEHGGKNESNCKGYNPNVWHMPSLLGVTTQTGDGNPGARPTSNQRQRQGRSRWAGFKAQELVTIT